MHADQLSETSCDRGTTTTSPSVKPFRPNLTILLSLRGFFRILSHLNHGNLKHTIHPSRIQPCCHLYSSHVYRMSVTSLCASVSGSLKMFRPVFYSSTFVFLVFQSVLCTSAVCASAEFLPRFRVDLTGGGRLIGDGRRSSSGSPNVSLRPFCFSSLSGSFACARGRCCVFAIRISFSCCCFHFFLVRLRLGLSAEGIGTHARG